MATTVTISRLARGQLAVVPSHVARKLDAWVEAVVRDGLAFVRRISGFHDEPLKGTRQGQRSIRLSRSCRAIYTKRDGGDIELVTVEEVTKHEY